MHCAPPQGRCLQLSGILVVGVAALLAGAALALVAYNISNSNAAGKEGGIDFTLFQASVGFAKRNPIRVFSNI